MSRICDICEKGYKKGNLVPRGIGNRVTSRSIRHQLPNLRTKKVEVNGTSITLKLCASCLKRLKSEELQLSAAENKLEGSSVTVA